MRALLCKSMLLGLVLTSPVQAATVVIVTDPMTLERRTVVVDSKGPDRVLLCALPPAVSGCRDVTPKRRQAG